MVDTDQEKEALSILSAKSRNHGVEEKKKKKKGKRKKEKRKHGKKWICFAKLRKPSQDRLKVFTLLMKSDTSVNPRVTGYSDAILNRYSRAQWLASVSSRFEERKFSEPGCDAGYVLIVRVLVRSGYIHSNFSSKRLISLFLSLGWRVRTDSVSAFYGNIFFETRAYCTCTICCHLHSESVVFRVKLNVFSKGKQCEWSESHACNEALRATILVQNGVILSCNRWIVGCTVCSKGPSQNFAETEQNKQKSFTRNKQNFAL